MATIRIATQEDKDIRALIEIKREANAAAGILGKPIIVNGGQGQAVELRTQSDVIAWTAAHGGVAP